MMQPVVSRSQRRLERKQLGLAVVLALAVAGVSFGLGVMYGRQTAPPALPVATTERSVRPSASQTVPPPPPATPAAPKAGVPEPEKLTFYDNLPKGSQAPLGSGINLPPEAATSVRHEASGPLTHVEDEPKSQVAVVPPPVAVPVAPPKPTAAPDVRADGAFVIQVASFRTREDAAKLAGKLEGYRMPPFIEQADLGSKGVWFRVFAGPFTTREGADNAVAMLKEKERLSAIVRQR